MARNVTRRVGGFLAAVAMAAAAFGSTANAAERNIDYVNLGDSYSAGFGTGSLTDIGGGCYQGTGSTHVTKLDSKKGVSLDLNYACAGADSATVAGIAATVAAPALRQAEIVTLTVGGNDLPWTDLFRACAYGTDLQCAGVGQAANAALGALDDKVKSTLMTIRYYAPNARIVILGYPQLFDGVYPNPLLTPAEVAGVRQLTTALNAKIAYAASQVRNTAFVDVTSRFAGHGVDSPDSWVYFNKNNLGDPYNLHPTSKGYLKAYYPATMSAISFGRLGR